MIIYLILAFYNIVLWNMLMICQHFYLHHVTGTTWFSHKLFDSIMLIEHILDPSISRETENDLEEK